MMIDNGISSILEAALAGGPLSKQDGVRLLQLGETSLEAGVLRAVADAMTRRRFGNAGRIYGQIGIEMAPCPGRCRFCGFGEGHTGFTPSVMPMADVVERARDFTTGGELSILFLMTMHVFDFERLLAVVHAVRDVVPCGTQLVVNIGDFDLSQARAMKAAGVDGAYHILRLREGIDTALDPAARMATIGHIREAGLDWHTCCEPVGPEHTAEEIADQLYLGVEYGCYLHAAMRRVALPGIPLGERGQLSELRVAQITTVIALATLAVERLHGVAVHEPSLPALMSGANAIWAESGANPRDTEADTAACRGRDIADCRQMLLEAGFASLLHADGTTRPLQPRTARTGINPDPLPPA